MANTTSVFLSPQLSRMTLDVRGVSKDRVGLTVKAAGLLGSVDLSVSAEAGEVLVSEIWPLRADLERRRERYSLRTDQVSITSPQSERVAEKMHGVTADLCRQVCRLFICDEGFKPDFPSLLPELIKPSQTPAGLKGENNEDSYVSTHKRPSAVFF